LICLIIAVLLVAGSNSHNIISLVDELSAYRATAYFLKGCVYRDAGTASAETTSVCILQEDVIAQGVEELLMQLPHQRKYRCTGDKQSVTPSIFIADMALSNLQLVSPITAYTSSFCSADEAAIAFWKVAASEIPQRGEAARDSDSTRLHLCMKSYKNIAELCGSLSGAIAFDVLNAASAGCDMNIAIVAQDAWVKVSDFSNAILANQSRSTRPNDASGETQIQCQRTLHRCVVSSLFSAGVCALRLDTQAGCYGLLGKSGVTRDHCRNACRFLESAWHYSSSEVVLTQQSEHIVGNDVDYSPQISFSKDEILLRGGIALHLGHAYYRSEEFSAAVIECETALRLFCDDIHYNDYGNCVLRQSSPATFSLFRRPPVSAPSAVLRSHQRHGLRLLALVYSAQCQPKSKVQEVLREVRFTCLGPVEGKRFSFILIFVALLL
jgi:hypothetical protein